MAAPGGEPEAISGSIHPGLGGLQETVVTGQTWTDKPCSQKERKTESCEQIASAATDCLVAAVTPELGGTLQLTWQEELVFCVSGRYDCVEPRDNA